MKDEYARVGVPMMPVVRGEAETRQLIVLYTVLLVALTLMPVVFGYFGLIYGAAALAPGRRVHLALAAAVARGAAPQRAAHVPVLPRLPRAAVLRDGASTPACRLPPLMDRRLARKNLRTAFIVCAIMLFMFAMTWVAALVYTQ